MLKSWSSYAHLKRKDKIEPRALESLDADAPYSESEIPLIVSLKALHELRHQGRGLLLLPAYAQAHSIYHGHQILSVDPSTYNKTPTTQRVNQFDALGPCYREELRDIYVELRLGCIISDAAAYASESVRVKTGEGEKSYVSLMVIDALRTVDAAYLLAASNPKAVEDKLLSTPGTSAHNKGMAVDLTLVYWDTKTKSWCDADMCGHIDHSDMQTNHRNYAHISELQRYHRLELERIMLRAAWGQGTLIAPLREEFWDFRFPEDALDYWRILESFARIIQDANVLALCDHTISEIRALMRADQAKEANTRFAMSLEGFKLYIERWLADEAKSEALFELLGVDASTLKHIAPVFHGSVNILYDADLPPSMRQAHPKLQHLLQ